MKAMNERPHDDSVHQPFNKKAFVVVMIVLSGLGLPFTGYANHLYQLEPIDLARHSWMAAHNALGVLFIIFTGWHAYLHRRPLARHLKAQFSKGSGVNRETLLAGSILFVVMFFAVGHAFVI